MKHTCDKCQTRYEIPDARVRGRFLKVRCKICQNTMRVVGIETVESRSGAVWWCAIQGKAQGPLREDEVLARIDIGDLHARTRMWCEGMTAWERMCESQTLAWAYGHLVARMTEDELLMAGEPSCVFERAALLSDGKGYFPDPTLKSGIIVLDEQTQSYLQQKVAPGSAANPVANTDVEKTGWVGPAIAAALGAAMAVGGFAWFLAMPL